MHGVYGGSEDAKLAKVRPHKSSTGFELVRFTQYWIPREGAYDVDDNGNKIFLCGPHTRSLRLDNGKVLEKTDKNTYSKCVEEGTCYLRNGDLINMGSTDTTFEILNKHQFPYGQGGYGKALVPFVSVASNDLKPGTKLLVRELQGFKLPNDKIHNGCVRVDDTGAGDPDHFDCHIDWFINTYPNELTINPRVPDRVHSKVSSGCKILNYK